MPTINDMQALNILRESSTKSYDAQANAQVASASSVVVAKTQQAQSSEKAAEGDRFSSVTKFASQGMGTLLNSRMAYKSTMMASHPKDPGQQATGAAIGATAQQGGYNNVVDKAGDVFDQNVGGAHDSAQAKIDGKNAETQDSMANQQLELAKANREKATKTLDGAEDFAKGFFERAKQIVDKMFQ